MQILEFRICKKRDRGHKMAWKRCGRRKTETKVENVMASDLATITDLSSRGSVVEAYLFEQIEHCVSAIFFLCISAFADYAQLSVL